MTEVAIAGREVCSLAALTLLPFAANRLHLLYVGIFRGGSARIATLVVRSKDVIYRHLTRYHGLLPVGASEELLLLWLIGDEAATLRRRLLVPRRVH